ncbi:bifunctional UDP-N-acetylglucosamine diphosphorylase/glucosamine-1-phosphate N-acetyltransferase GlmU [Sporanaerobium hydrogeniformans]|uniref:Bifunctional UDP-N-acetylglucosamine diphosphorylase/glucosamine-1-phosphate N-acetyltransferase GlmU n=1 Tax=Sporanaerobium hydrogeniformans TaxID=3072179 RepID=A0AC61DC71_9FIRM|nr:bifunctional UDP-N-acetylglucosamine diphosphorylase/glucosamine-1-phosphate N-acetyltransferase GlmU [Sporanaerobium hydrogeniformans]PHV70375.1 bifunctional UDP-N-acetylglucosamine diphosphorylase/glucosamine-1-phosphate N-acetyltransferase GlmU [Sporanaerobium hydrogeniformans]
MKTKALILAAGQGTRMQSEKSKVLHKVLDKTLIEYPILASKQVGVTDTCIIVGHKAEEVKKALGDEVSYVLQKEQLGTGHAVMQALDFIGDEGEILILYGDTPLITGNTLEKMLIFHRENKNAVTVLSAQVNNPQGYGRIVRNKASDFIKIVEQKDASEEEKQIKEINGGMYVFEAKLLKLALSQLTNDNAQKEYYLTDTLEILLREGYKVDAVVADEMTDILGVNSREQLAEVTELMRKRIHLKHMQNGVTLVDPSHTYIGIEVEIGKDTVIEPGCILEGKTSIGEGCRIGYHSRITNTILRAGVEVDISVITDSFIDEDTHVGPFAYIRPNSHIGKNIKVGDFVEIKNATIGDGTKISHLTYIGDADVGEKVNFGCGTVVVNYDGQKKHRTTIKDNAFIGCNTNLVSPVVVEEGAYTAAGSTITKTVPKDSLGIARAKQENKVGWVAKKRQK